MSARARRLTVLLAIVLALGSPVAVALATSGPGGSSYRVRSGDTITSIAVQLRLPGGWQQLYDANRGTIGDDPGRLRVGEELVIPQGAVPAADGYVVEPGDTLSSIAGRMHVAGGPDALYAANRQVIGADPNRLEVGQTLLPPGMVLPTQPPAAQSTAPAPAHTAAPTGKSLTAQAPVAQGPPGGTQPATGSSSGSHGHPVLWTAVAAVLLLLLVLLVLVALPRRRRARGGEVWVGGDYSAEHQPTPRKADAEGSVVTAFRPSSVSRSAAPRPEPVPAEAWSEAVRVRPAHEQDEPGPAERLQPERSQPDRVRAEHVQPDRAQTEGTQLQWPQPEGRQPERVQRLQPTGPSSRYDQGLADELFGEVRLVDPSTPLTRDQRSQG